MPKPRFLQIHSLHGYTAALLNRDDSGLAKRLPYGGVMRTRISSQCLKRHWRMAEQDPHALQSLAGYVDSHRSRELVTRKVFEPLAGAYPQDVLDALAPEFQKAVYGKNADKGVKSRQTLLLGAPETAWLKAEAERLASAAAGNAQAAAKAAAEWAKAYQANTRAMREATALPGGIAAAMFGRMITSDPAANIEAPIHVAHAFTVHEEEAEGDYFTAVDDLRDADDDSGADTIQETELTSGLFYGYVVVDLPGLIANCGGDRDLAGRIVHNLVYLIAEVSPGAKRGSTAPYGRAGFMLLEAGDRQPRSLAGAYRVAGDCSLERSIGRLSDHLAVLDGAYATGEDRRHLSIANEAAPATATVAGSDVFGGDRCALADLAAWAAERAGDAP